MALESAVASWLCVAGFRRVCRYRRPSVEGARLGTVGRDRPRRSALSAGDQGLVSVNNQAPLSRAPLTGTNLSDRDRSGYGLAHEISDGHWPTVQYKLVCLNELQASNVREFAPRAVGYVRVSACANREWRVSSRVRGRQVSARNPVAGNQADAATAAATSTTSTTSTASTTIHGRAPMPPVASAGSSSATSTGKATTTCFGRWTGGDRAAVRNRSRRAAGAR
jgi:hypothetical protein